jgi:hypothetical protein
MFVSGYKSPDLDELRAFSASSWLATLNVDTLAQVNTIAACLCKRRLEVATICRCVAHIAQWTACSSMQCQAVRGSSGSQHVASGLLPVDTPECDWIATADTVRGLGLLMGWEALTSGRVGGQLHPAGCE